MKQRILFLLLTVVFGLTISATAVAQNQWVKLGEKSVNFKADRDEIKCSHKGDFSKLKIKVENNPVEFEKVIVDYKKGGRQELSIRNLIRAGGETRVLDLRGQKREIRSIIFHYKSQKGINGNKKAKVQVWGRR